MNQNFTIKLKDTICSSCYCVDRYFLHHVWKGKKGHLMCTSCVLFEHKMSFCPTCFCLLDGAERVICCSRCESETHVTCMTDKESIDEFKCSTCKYPDRLIFELKGLKDVEPREDNGSYKLMDMKAANLLFTAAKIVQKLLSKAHDESVRVAMIHATNTVSAKKAATDAVRRFMKFEESNDGPSLLDRSLETARETGKLPA